MARSYVMRLGGGVGALGRFVIIAVVLALAACGEGSKAQPGASVTLKLPPARAYAPKPAFSFGSVPRETAEAEVKN